MDYACHRQDGSDGWSKHPPGPVIATLHTQETTMSQPPTTRWRISPAAWVPIALAIGAEATSNGLRAYSLGTHLDRFTLPIQGVSVSVAGIVLVLGAIAISVSQSRAAWVALTPGETLQRWVAGLAAIVLLAISITAMASHILEAQRAKLSDEGGARSRYDRAQAAHAAITTELARLGSIRTVAVIDAAIAAAPIDMTAWRRSAQCTEISRPDTKQACAEVLALRTERGAALRKAELEPQAQRLAETMSVIGRPEAATASEGALGDVWAWIMGLGVVAVATFGPVIFGSPCSGATLVVPSGPELHHPARGSANDNTGETPAEPTPPGRGTEPVVDWVREFRRFHGRNPQIPELQARFPAVPKTTAWRRCKVA